MARFWSFTANVDREISKSFRGWVVRKNIWVRWSGVMRVIVRIKIMTTATAPAKTKVIKRDSKTGGSMVFAIKFSPPFQVILDNFSHAAQAKNWVMPS